MTAYCLASGQLRQACAADTAREGGQIYHLTADGRITRQDVPPALQPGEGLLVCTEGFYVEPVEMQVDFLKAEDAAAWLEKMAVRHIDRVRCLDEELWVLAQIGGEEG